MKQITFLKTYTVEQEVRVRNNRDDLIRQIVERTDAIDKKKLAKRIAITANTFHWSEMDLHALLKKEVKNYSAFVNWSLKTK
jgi:hypothetical protein